MNAEKVILWDFDGTLGGRPREWRGCLMEILDRHEPGHNVDVEEIRSYLRDGFPWHRPDVAHPELSTTDAWWAHVEPLLVRSYEGVRIEPERARVLGRLAREHYVDARQWTLFDDTLTALRLLQERGWSHIILSNHVPELRTIVEHLGLNDLVDEVVNSAETGYEKPHPGAFDHARRAAGNPEQLWMVGDNPHADVDGAEAAGIPAILISRKGHANRTAPRTVRTLTEVGGWL